MRLQSVTLRNYRIHRQLQVAFDASRTLIGGPNESGKSTLIEAIHRALFLKACGNSQELRDMLSLDAMGQPEVELQFECGGTSYRLTKRFGASGTTLLSCQAADPLRDDSADAELARLLGLNTGLSPRARVRQWAHLWVWQGAAGQDPCETSAPHHGDLVRRLHDRGGGTGVMQSDLDDRVARLFAGAAGTFFNTHGKPKAGSVLAQAEEALTQAHVAAEAARSRWNQFEATAAALAEARHGVDAALEASHRLRLEEEETERRLRALADLQGKEREAATVLEKAAARLAELRDIQSQIARLRADIEARSLALAPLRAQVAELTAALEGRRTECHAAETRYAAALEQVRAARLNNDLARAWRGRLENRQQLRELADQHRKAGDLRSQLADVRREIARLPAVDSKSVHRLQTLQREHETAAASLRSMAAAVEVLSADQSVTVSGDELFPGERRVFTDEGEIAVGSGVRLRILPGGGASLAESRGRERDASAEFKRELDRLGMTTPDEASAACQRLDLLEAKRKQIDAQLDGMRADRIEQALFEANERLARADAEIERLERLIPDAPRELVSDAAARWEAACQERLRMTDGLEVDTKATRDLAARVCHVAETALNEARTNIGTQEVELEETRSRLRFIQQERGNDADIERAVRTAAAESSSARPLWESLVRQISELQPSLLDQQKRRQGVVREQTDRGIAEHRERIAACQALLQAAGTEDPRGALNLAEAMLRSAQKRRDGARIHAQAVKLLDDLFQEEQEALADQLTRPLQEKVSGYLHCLFGPGTDIRLEFTGSTFGDLHLVRSQPGAARFRFNQLSGGAREQTAIAVRLAMAEVLAEGHDGCLPVVLDDAFAYSDPQRVRQLQDMLFLASERGLQVIVLTCNPADYMGLGGHVVTLGAGMTV